MGVDLRFLLNALDGPSNSQYREEKLMMVDGNRGTRPIVNAITPTGGVAQVFSSSTINWNVVSGRQLVSQSSTKIFR